MNRDEKLTRAKGLPPKLRVMKGVKILCPSEPGGGTWIALNDGGATLALINWYSVVTRVARQPLSRGQVVQTVSASRFAAEAQATLAGLPLHRINPFRLVGVFPATKQIVEWRWDLKQLVPQRHRWTTRQWVSSGFDEPAAQRTRGNVFRRALRQRSAGSRDWLRRLHRSHSPQAGPFSTCMHRADAATVSYTEVSVSSRRAVIRHRTGAPCGTSEQHVRHVRLLHDKVFGSPAMKTQAMGSKAGADPQPAAPGL